MTTEVDRANAVMQRAIVEIESLRTALREIYGEARCARVQRIPTDDAIIAEHIENIERLSLAALRRQA